MHFLILGRSVGLKKKNHKKSRNRRPWYPTMTLKVNIYIFALTKCTISCQKCSCFSLCCYYAHFPDEKELFQVKIGLTTLLVLFFFENSKNLGRSDDAKRRKKRGWPYKTWQSICRGKLNLSSVSVWYCIKSHSDCAGEYVSVWQGVLQITRLSCRKWLFTDSHS